MYQPSFESAHRNGQPLWVRARLLGAVAGTLAKAARLLLTPSDHAPARGPHVNGRHPPRIVLTVGVEVDGDAGATAKPTLERLLELTLELRDGYENPCWLSAPELGELSRTCREHARRQTALARRIAARLTALGSRVEVSAGGLGSIASGVSGGPPEVELGRLLSAHHAILAEARAFGRFRAAAARTTQQEIVVADVVATNRRQAATLERRCGECRGG